MSFDQQTIDPVDRATRNANIIIQKALVNLNLRPNANQLGKLLGNSFRYASNYDVLDQLLTQNVGLKALADSSEIEENLAFALKSLWWHLGDAKNDHSRR